ncbi:MAG: Crp/Fnr family transcriptional regulator [Salinivirgaceae bacterium]|nr:Crp/Fnr family transcriptional regulator [Salinivirgaceae bacterium]MDD4747619.1 Crp/Fnr family transcriptional regulator [Salinivirgaceae bacterium]MDY0279110.1 Crp/Fnr family transcriptional regulator [Salinivirgaceae bacterium]
MANMFTVLTHNQLFMGITTPELHELFKCIHFGIRTYNKGQLIAVAGDKCNNLMILLSGVVKGEMVDFSGRTIKVEDIEAPRPIAPVFLFGKNAFFPVNITTIKEAEILYIGRDNLVTLMQKDNRVLINYLDIVSDKGQFLSDKLRFLSFNTIREKLAHYLIENTMEKNAISFDPNMSQTALAEIFGVARPSLARTIGELVDQGIIEYTPRWITVKKMNDLKNIILKNVK